MYLAAELGGGLDEQDLLELGHYQCYARLTDAATGERLPAFSLRLDRPPPSDLARAQLLAEVSSSRYGRDAVDVDLDLQSALERMHGPRWSGWATTGPEAADDPISSSTPVAEDSGPAAGGIVAGSSVPLPRRTRGRRTRRSRPRRPEATSAPDVRAEWPDGSTSEDG